MWTIDDHRSKSRGLGIEHRVVLEAMVLLRWLFRPVAEQDMVLERTGHQHNVLVLEHHIIQRLGSVEVGAPEGANILHQRVALSWVHSLHGDEKLRPVVVTTKNLERHCHHLEQLLELGSRLAEDVDDDCRGHHERKPDDLAIKERVSAFRREQAFEIQKKQRFRVLRARNHAAREVDASSASASSNTEPLREQDVPQCALAAGLRTKPDHNLELLADISDKILPVLGHLHLVAIQELDSEARREAALCHCNGSLEVLLKMALGTASELLSASQLEQLASKVSESKLLALQPGKSMRELLQQLQWRRVVGQCRVNAQVLGSVLFELALARNNLSSDGTEPLLGPLSETHAELGGLLD